MACTLLLLTVKLMSDVRFCGWRRILCVLEIARGHMHIIVCMYSATCNSLGHVKPKILWLEENLVCLSEMTDMQLLLLTVNG